jgi:hypothetical protein
MSAADNKQLLQQIFSDLPKVTASLSWRVGPMTIAGLLRAQLNGPERIVPSKPY